MAATTTATCTVKVIRVRGGFETTAAALAATGMTGGKIGLCGRKVAAGATTCAMHAAT